MITRRSATIGLGSTFVGTAAAAEEVTPAKPDPVALASSFWNEWGATRNSATYTALASATGCGCTTGNASLPQTNSGGVVDIAVTKPADAAKLLTSSVAASRDPITEDALSTVIAMRVSPAVREAAVPLVPAEAQAHVTQFNANLSQGIAGLPGIYLNYDPGSSGEAARAPAPAGFTSMPGGGCPGR